MYAMGLTLLEMSGKPHTEISSTWLPKQEQDKDGNNRQANLGRETTWCSNPRQRTTGKEGILRSEK